jgi:hypothetical protein
MFEILIWKLGLYQKYEIEYNSCISGDKNEIIEFYYYKNCPEWLLKEAVLKWLKGRIQTCFSNLVYIERINKWYIKKVLVY